MGVPGGPPSLPPGAMVYVVQPGPGGQQQLLPWQGVAATATPSVELLQEKERSSRLEKELAREREERRKAQEAWRKTEKRAP